MVKHLPANARNTRDPSSTPGSEGSPGEGNGNPRQYSCLENSMDRRSWPTTIHGTTEHTHTQYIYTMEYYSVILKKKKRNEILPFSEMWMDPETDIQGEVKSEREK